MKSILFICDTNISLSPLMKGIMERLISERRLAEKFVVKSAGSHPGNTPRAVERKTLELAARHGISLSGEKSRAVSVEDILSSYRVIVMNEDNYLHIKTLVPDISSEKLKLLMEYSGQLGTREMPDPLMGEISYEEAYTILEKVARGVLQYLQKQLT